MCKGEEERGMKTIGGGKKLLSFRKKLQKDEMVPSHAWLGKFAFFSKHRVSEQKKIAGCRKRTTA